MKHNIRRPQSPTTRKGRYLRWQTRFLCASMKWLRSWGCPCPKNSKQLAKYLLAVLIPIAYLLDLIKLLVIALFYELRSAIGYIVTFFRAVKRAIVALVSWGLKLSDKHIVAVSFRLALIFALVSIVVLNRYQPVFKEYEESTAVFEFLASSIIIPIVFEWIYSIRNTSGTQEG